MVQPYEPLTDERTAHTSRTSSGYKAIHSSGDAHYYLGDQNQQLPTIEAATGLFERNGLVSPFSNGPESREYPIATPTGNYRILTNPNKTINISSLIQNASFEFNIYSQRFRN
jgi:hypothetical protein